MGNTNTDQLQGRELWTVIGLSFILTPLAGAAYYYKWKDSHPRKARTANRIAWISFAIWTAAAIYLDWAGYIDLFT